MRLAKAQGRGHVSSELDRRFAVHPWGVAVSAPILLSVRIHSIGGKQ